MQKIYTKCGSRSYCVAFPLSIPLFFVPFHPNIPKAANILSNANNKPNIQENRMMTPAEKAEKATEILNNNPSEEDITIGVGLAREAAAEDDPDGLCIMAQAYYQGMGVETDYKQSFELAQKALAAGNEKAKVLLAIYYAMGDAVERDLPLAEQYLKDNMAMDICYAYIVMGNFVFQGVFTDIEWSTFPNYFIKANEIGEPKALIQLAEKYHLLCEPDQAEYWYSKVEDTYRDAVEESKSQFTDDNYPQRRETALNFYINKGMYDKVFALVDRDAATGDLFALYQQAGCYAQGLGDEAYGRDVKKALQIYERLAAEGESQANFVMGHLYYTVEEIKDLQKTVYYTQKAAEAGNANAQCVLGKFYAKGELVEKNLAKATAEMEKAAAQGDAEALFVLATNYLQDADVRAASVYALGYERDEERGIQLLQQAAEAGSGDAMFSLYHCCHEGKYLKQDDTSAFLMLDQSTHVAATPEKARLLGNAYRDGIGVSQDYNKAFECYSWAASKGDILAIGSLGLMFQEGKGVEKNQETADALLSQYNEWMRWTLDDILPLDVAQEKAQQGDANAMYQLGNRYHEGDEVEQNMDKAVEWWQKAHEAGNIEATHNLGVFALAQGDAEKGVEYLTQSSTAGYIRSFHVLGQHYLCHTEEEGHIQKAIDALTTAAEQGYTLSQWDLAVIYHDDDDYVSQDYDKARYWLEKCLEADYPPAHYAIGKTLVNGDLYKQDYNKALEHLRTAVEQGVHDADALYLQLRWEGKGVEANREEVVKVFAKLAEDNDAIAIYQLYWLYNDDSYEQHDTNKAFHYLKQSADLGYTNAVTELASIYIMGKEGVLDPDYDKAISLLQPLLEKGKSNGEVCYWMAHALKGKCDMKNAYSWEQASQAFDYMHKAAEEGYVDGMYSLAQFYLTGYGVLSLDTKEEKEWLQKYIDHGGTVKDEENPMLCSDEEWDILSGNQLYNDLKFIVNDNIERIDNPLEMIDAENHLNVENICLNAAQLGVANALYALGQWGLSMLKTEPEKAKTYISIACKGEMPQFAYHAGMEWIEEGFDNEAAAESAIGYFCMGAEQGLVDCLLQMGLFCTDTRLKGVKYYDKMLKNGIKCLQAVTNIEDDYFEEQRQQARARLDEIEQRQQSTWGKLKKGFKSWFDKD